MREGGGSNTVAYQDPGPQALGPMFGEFDYEEKKILWKMVSGETGIR